MNSPLSRSEAVVLAECVGCERRREILAGEVADGDVPVCSFCFSPMVAVEAMMERSL